MKGILNDLNFEYLKSLRPMFEPLLQRICDYAEKNDIPIVSYEVGKFLELMTLIKDPENVIEVGTAIGFSGIFIARALKMKGKLTTIDHSEDSIKKAKENFKKAGVANKISIIHGDANEILSKLEKDFLSESIQWRFDMAFIDATKEEYKEYLEHVIKLMEPGGIIIIDNLLWHGQTAGGPIIAEKYKDSTVALRKFNKFFLTHPGLISTILPIGDGTGLAVVR